jgi:hypothetical protein
MKTLIFRIFSAQTTEFAYSIGLVRAHCGALYVQYTLQKQWQTVLAQFVDFRPTICPTSKNMFNNTKTRSRQRYQFSTILLQ